MNNYSDFIGYINEATGIQKSNPKTVSEDLGQKLTLQL